MKEGYNFYLGEKCIGMTLYDGKGLIVISCMKEKAVLKR